MSREWVRRLLHVAAARDRSKSSGRIDLVFKIGGKMFAVMALEPARACLVLQMHAEDFEDLIERPGIIPAPYLARAKWVALESFDAMQRKELEPRLEASL